MNLEAALESARIRTAEGRGRELAVALKGLELGSPADGGGGERAAGGGRRDRSGAAIGAEQSKGR
jgi:hypothetical protein